MNQRSLADRFAAHLAELEVPRAGCRLIVAASGGIDSTVLLHLLRFSTPVGSDMLAAHLDHRMRPSSGGDLLWLRGLCRAWRIPFSSAAVSVTPRNENEAREARYAYLRELAGEAGDALVLTAHHADDQAETVLFRILRGTGLRGLAGIPEESDRAVLRPLLPFWRSEIAEYAKVHGLRWRTDETNSHHGPLRNRIRHAILPDLERHFAGVRKNLVNLADLAAESESHLGAEVIATYAALVEEDGEASTFDRTALREQPPAVASRLVRKAVRRLGCELDRPGTRSALQFITDAPSGRQMPLPGDLRIRLDFDTATVERVEVAAEPDEDLTAELPPPESGRDYRRTIRLGGRQYTLHAAATDGAETANGSARWTTRLQLPAECFPLTVRSRRPGDRFRVRGATKSLKKLMIEGQIPSGERATYPVVVDSEQRVVWVAGWDGYRESNSENIALNLAIYDD